MRPRPTNRTTPPRPPLPRTSRRRRPRPTAADVALRRFTRRAREPSPQPGSPGAAHFPRSSPFAADAPRSPAAILEGKPTPRKNTGKRRRRGRYNPYGPLAAPRRIIRRPTGGRANGVRAPPMVVYAAGPPACGRRVLPLPDTIDPVVCDVASHPVDLQPLTPADQAASGQAGDGRRRQARVLRRADATAPGPRATACKCPTPSCRAGRCRTSSFLKIRTIRRENRS